MLVGSSKFQNGTGEFGVGFELGLLLCRFNGVFYLSLLFPLASVHGRLCCECVYCAPVTCYYEYCRIGLLSGCCLTAKPTKKKSQTVSKC